MSFNIWTPVAVSSKTQDWSGIVWRIIEAQHIASTMKIVDDFAEQSLLEELLERSKPPLPSEADKLHYLLATPFRYPPHHGSRFRGIQDPGVFYGAASTQTACAELGYWRWKFLSDAVDLEKLEPTAHTVFRTNLSAKTIDLRSKAFAKQANFWTHKNDYTATQAFARIAREVKTEAIFYQSVRDPDPSWCIAVLTPKILQRRKPVVSQQTWWLAVYPEQVVWRSEEQSLTFASKHWV